VEHASTWPFSALNRAMRIRSQIASCAVLGVPEEGGDAAARAIPWDWPLHSGRVTGASEPPRAASSCRRRKGKHAGSCVISRAKEAGIVAIRRRDVSGGRVWSVPYPRSPRASLRGSLDSLPTMCCLIPRRRPATPCLLRCQRFVMGEASATCGFSFVDAQEGSTSRGCRRDDAGPPDCS
jgi:hypothetical protein